MSFATNILLKAFHKASNQAQGAEKLFARIGTALKVEDFERGRAYCDELTALSEQAAAAYRAQVAQEEAAARQERTDQACPITPLDEFHALVANDQAHQRSAGLVVVIAEYEASNALAA